MKTATLSVLMALVTVMGLPGGPAGAIGPIFVDKDATGANNGSSWADAYTSLYSALAVDSDSSVVYVASGTYTTSGPGFIIDKDVKLYGGFEGTETSAAERDFANTPPTILSGDAGVKGDITDNATHVVNFFGAVAPTLDGFVITGGNAQGESGGGIEATNLSAQATFRNLLITGIRASSGGGGMYLDGDAIFTNVTFAENEAGFGGALRVAGSDTAQFTNPTFSGNKASTTGGGDLPGQFGPPVPVHRNLRGEPRGYECGWRGDLREWQRIRSLVWRERHFHGQQPEPCDHRRPTAVNHVQPSDLRLPLLRRGRLQ